MTRRQKQCLDFIKEHIATYGRSPTMREISRGLCLFSTGRAFELVRALELRGEIFVGPFCSYYNGTNPINSRGISIFHEISRGPDGITMYAAWPGALNG